MNKLVALKNRLFAKEDGDSNVMTVLILVLIAVGLCVIFRNHIAAIMDTIVTKVNNGVNTLANDISVVNPTP